MALALGLGYKGNIILIREWKEDYLGGEVEKAERREAMPMGEFRQTLLNPKYPVFQIHGKEQAIIYRLWDWMDPKGGDFHPTRWREVNPLSKNIKEMILI